MPTLVFLLSSNINSFKLILCTLIDVLFNAIHKCSSRYKLISVLTTYTFMVRQVCIMEPSFFKKRSGRHRRPIGGRHLIILLIR